MGAFCVYGISKSMCRAAVERKTPVLRLTISEYSEKCGLLAAKMFDETDKRTKISPEFDAPQFCRDWIAADPSHVKSTKIMVRAEKTDKNGERVLKGGAPVMTWVEYVEPKAMLF